MNEPDLSQLAELPVDVDGPVFKAPWEAQAFALVVKLQQQGVFSWDEWAQEMNQSINDARTAGDLDLGDTYYQHWLTTLEKITLSKGLATQDNLTEHKQAAHEAQQALHHDHPHSHEHEH